MTKKFGLYLHVPFCVHKCSYCDFFSFTKYRPNDFEAWALQIIRELQKRAPFVKEKIGVESVTSVFFGGGTPSLVPVSWLDQIFQEISKWFSLSKQTEITLEANPETVTLEYLNLLKKYTPVNRISLGAQSFNSQNLKILERLASPQSVVHAVSLLNQANFSNFNLDLMFAIPGQSIEDSLEDLSQAIRLSPTHLSFYQLTLKPGHSLYRQLPQVDVGVDYIEGAKALLEKHGLLQYEISNYAKAGFESVHNLTYWEGGSYLGVGPSASSRLFLDNVYWHHKQLSDFNRYLGLKDSFGEFESINKDATLLEALFLSLRLNRGVNVDVFYDTYGYSLKDCRKFQTLLDHGFTEWKDPILKLSSRGLMIEEEVVLQLLA